MSDNAAVAPRLVDLLLLAASVGVPVMLGLLWPVQPWRPGVIRLAPWAVVPALLTAFLVPVGTTIDVAWLLLGTRLGLDAAAPTLLWFTALLWGTSGAFASAYLDAGAARDRFFLFHLVAMAGNLGLVLSLDAPNYYAFFALMSFASYGLVVHEGHEEARRAGRIYMYLVIAGELLLFAALVLTAVDVGTTRLPVPADATLSTAALACAVLGFGIKAGLLPLHVWLPLAHPVAPTPASAVLSGAMIKAGILGWMRFVPLGSVPRPGWGGLLVVLGLVATFYGVGVGLLQRNPKTVLAYSSISQMGFLTIGVGAALVVPEAWPALGTVVLVYALHHGLAKGALFLGVGVMGAGGSRWRPWVTTGMALPALALMGAPLTSGAAAKSALKAAVSTLPGAWAGWLGWLLPLAAVGTGVLMVRLMTLLWQASTGEDDHLTAGVWLPWAVLVVASTFACALWPMAGEAWRVAAMPSEVVKAIWPVAMGALAGVAAWRWWWRRDPVTAPLVPAGDLLVVVEAAGRAWTPGRIGPIAWRESLARSRAPRVPAVIARLGRTAADWFDSMDRALERWPVAGSLFIVLAAALVWLLGAG